MGAHADIQANYPYTYAINPESGGQTLLDFMLLDRVKSESLPNFDLVFDCPSLLRKSPIALAFALSRENASVEQIDSLYKLVVELSAQALFFNFDQESPSIIGAYPFTVQYIHVLDHEPIDREVREIVSDLYRGRLKVNIFDEFVAVLKRVEPRRSHGATIRVVDVQVQDKAKAYLPKVYAENETNLKHFVADAFGSYLSKNQNIPVLPYAKGHAINNTMAIAVADGSVYNLRIPDSDYAIELTLRGFKKVLFDQRAAGEAWIYGAFFHVRLAEPEFGRVYLDADFKQGATKKVPTGQQNVEDWPAYQEVMLKLFDELTTVVSKPTRDWVKAHASEEALPGLKKFREVVKRCA